ncbi:roadblock/LC7 domain-containing protein [Actinomadura luteofluorescens]|uniref:roadblock/LC7 domain-containing protein n=1 Tax=Actinomadura luteofluorescens TaxID=46163 RepID=UPI00362EE0F4
MLLSSDGMMKAADGFDRASAEHLAALASGLFSIARSAGTKFDDSNEVRQVVTELKSSQLYISWVATTPCSRCSPGRRPTRPSWVLRWPG